MMTYEHWEHHTLPDFPSDSETRGAREALKWAYDHYDDQLMYACSFGIEGIVLIDLISSIRPDASIVFLDTNYHFQETYDIIDKVKQRYPSLHIHLKQPALTIEEQIETYGEDLWKQDPNMCCQLRKIIPLKEALEPATAWISGLRREQSNTRKHTNYVNQDHKFKKIKICPLIHWTWKEVWRYVHKHQLDYHALHDQGYPSIGCHPCTKPAISMEDLRSGRWTNSGKTECGLHTD
ncbi:phosphoadenylyl-sulfate reductase [Bacillus sp. REN10]|uniref:phosphoadenylyl-sulfate reductase n=1 Tax=Bacillus sp. REN10 TaxID=2782541 RepID=UPI00193BF483|nr:phosphoadenylyl-sulfate reductase [Bacillus sp. REN10]